MSLHEIPLHYKHPRRHHHHRHHRRRRHHFDDDNRLRHDDLSKWVICGYATRNEMETIACSAHGKHCARNSRCWHIHSNNTPYAKRTMNKPSIARQWHNMQLSIECTRDQCVQPKSVHTLETRFTRMGHGIGHVGGFAKFGQRRACVWNPRHECMPV